MKEYKNIKAILEEGGTRFEYLFDTLEALDYAIGNFRRIEGFGDPAYLEEKLRKFEGGADMVIHDVKVWMKRNEIGVPGKQPMECGWYKEKERHREAYYKGRRNKLK